MYVYQRICSEDGDAVSPDTENFHNLTWLSAQKDFIERLYHCVSIKSHKNHSCAAI